ncbi:hypothetical protein ABMA28_013110 [Loxostege sticticalis]|uniref:Lebercilin domain-containing protein n=1 Tax=Loxostege sticticalis TaxID=481309 RepID=A0ABD0S3L7_LOXSC
MYHVLFPQVTQLSTMKVLNQGKSRSHSVRFTSDDTTSKYKSTTDTQDSLPNYIPQYQGNDSGAPSPDSCTFQPAAQRFRLNEQRIKLLTSINQVVQQRAELESNRTTLSGLLDELRRKLKRRIEECHFEKKEKMKALKQANQRLEKEKYTLMSDIEHMKRHLEREEAHHVKHAIQGIVRDIPTNLLFTPCSLSELPNAVCRSVAKNAPSRVADNKLAAARLMRDIAELRQRVAQVEARLANELKRKRQAELDIVRLRKELSATKSCVASLRLPGRPQGKHCSKFA